MFKQNYVLEQLVTVMDKLRVSKGILAMSGLGLVAAKEDLWGICNCKVRDRVRDIVGR